MNRPRDREHLAALIRRETRRDQGSGFQRGLDNEAALGETRDEAVATRKIRGVGFSAKRKFRYQGAARHDLLRERRVATGIRDVDTGAEHGNGRAASLKASTVSLAVHADRQAAHDRKTRVAERARERVRI